MFNTLELTTGTYWLTSNEPFNIYQGCGQFSGDTRVKHACLLELVRKQCIPPIQASWSGEKVNSGGFTVAPCSSSSFTHSRLPAAQASHSGVLPSMLRASTWKTESRDFVRKNILATPSRWASNSNILSPEHQHPAAVEHTGSVPVYTPRGGGWWSRRPRCSPPRPPRSAAAAGGPCPAPPPRARLTGRSRIQGHELQIWKSTQQ